MANQPVHVNINQEIQDWKDARYGRQVRAANVSALNKLQDQTNAAVDYVVEKGEAVNQAARDVQTVRQEAQGAVDHANDITAEYKQYADDKLAATELERQAAQTARAGSEAAATLAESWAVGGTGSRPGEDGENSKFHAEKSKESAERATQEADRAAQYASIVAPGFLVDPDSMELYMKTGVGVDFIVTDDAELCWKIA
ncbi:hypothetical protein [Enterocloster lavalensis]|uniref:hypothetical protein n=1 Tax=Enterocloster lavalensis TaxID=460384 RepID=UPI00205700E2|nr:MAG TPA: tail fiber protein [Caudoviricetes sp.]